MAAITTDRETSVFFISFPTKVFKSGGILTDFPTEMEVYAIY